MVEVVVISSAFEEKLVVGVLSDQIPFQMEVPPAILGDGVRELKVKRDGLQLDVPGDWASVTTLLAISIAIAALTRSCPSLTRRCPKGLRVLRGVL